MRVPSARIVALLWLAGVLVPAAVAAGGHAPGELLVKLRATGPHAVEACAEAASRRGASLAPSTADSSDSLDRIAEGLGVRRIRALFRHPDDRTLADRRRTQRAVAEHRRAGLPAALRDRLPDPPDLAHVYRVQLPRGADVAAAVARYRSDPHVAWAQPNYEVTADAQFDDPFLASSGSWGQDFADLWGLHRIRAPEAWDLARGEGIVVAVIDTGVDVAHPDLVANAWVNEAEDLDGDGLLGPADRNGIDDDGNGYVDDVNGFDFFGSVDADGDGRFDGPDDVSDPDPFDDGGHGTHVAGTVAAVGNNGIGVAGVAPEARIMALKGFPGGGSSTIEILARAMLYAAQNGARVMNNSWSCGQRCPDNPLAEEMVALVHSLGVVVVTSAGNKADDVVFFSPERLRETIVVAATNEDDVAAGFSNFGFLVDVAAPGAGDPRTPGVRVAGRSILSTKSAGANSAATGDGLFVLDDDYFRWSGTSMATPHVAGLVAVLLSRNPDWTFEEVRAALRLGAADLGPPGHDRAFGAGRIDALASLSARVPDLRAGFTAPGQGAIVSQRQGVLALRGFVEGEDLAEWSIALGRGADPTTWQTLVGPTSQPPDGGLLLAWEIGELADGRGVLRLDARGRDGQRIQEFLLLSLERNPPFRISSEGANAEMPDISGARVVWTSRRAREDDPEAEDADVFLSDLATGVEMRLVDDPGEQRLPAIAGRHVAWLTQASVDVSQVSDCVVGHRRGCRPRTLTTGPLRRQAPAVSRRRVVWSERDTHWNLQQCKRPFGRCHPEPVASHPSQQLDPSLAGEALAWSDDRNGLPEVTLCDLRAGACTPETLPGSVGPSDLALTEEVVAWWTLNLQSLIFACDRRAGPCPRFLGLVGVDSHTDASGRRIVWHGPGGREDRDVYFCELDRVTGACPVQRLTGAGGEQRRPAIDGDRVVWEDDRGGGLGIYGIVLPHLTPPGDRVVRAGRPLRIPIRAGHPDEALVLSATLADGSPLASLGVVLRDHGGGVGELRWWPGEAHVGEHAFTLAVHTEGRLAARRSFRVAVREPAPGRPHHFWRVFGWLLH